LCQSDSKAFVAGAVYHDHRPIHRRSHAADMRIHRKRRRQSAEHSRPHPHLTFCVLCGCHCAPADCRYVDASVAQRAVRSRCAPTQFHYAAVMALPPADRRAMCLPCVNWRRHPRGARGIRREKLRSYTPLDRSGLIFLLPLLRAPDSPPPLQHHPLRARPRLLPRTRPSLLRQAGPRRRGRGKRLRVRHPGAGQDRPRLRRGPPPRRHAVQADILLVGAQRQHVLLPTPGDSARRPPHALPRGGGGRPPRRRGGPRGAEALEAVT